MDVEKIDACWIVTEGMAGTENQCLGVAEALGVKHKVKRIKLRQPWKLLSPFFGAENPWTFKPALTPPWPELLIASGRKSVAASRYIKKASGGKTFTVQIQDPRIDPKNFDLVVVPEHDPSRGENVLVTVAAPNRVTQERLDEATARFSNLGAVKQPRVAVLIGGDSKAHKLTPAIMRTLVMYLKKLSQTHGLMLTASRRTSGENRLLLNQTLKNSGGYVWDGNGENPYFGMLAWADFIIVTSDSVSMISEAATTGKPVYMIPLEGGAKRLNKFHQNLLDAGIVRTFEGKLEHWEYTPLRDAQNTADEIKKRLKNHQ